MGGGDKDDGLKLSLSLGFGNKSEKHHHHHQKNNPSPPLAFPLNLMPSRLPNFMQQHQQQHQLQKGSFLADVFRSSSERNGAEPRTPSLRGIDVNRPATGMYYNDKEVIVSSPNSTVSSVSGKRSEREEHEAERGSSSMEDDAGDASGRKKLRLSKEQAALLEETFKDHHTLNTKQKQALAKHLNLRPRQVEVWFQNRRARTKLKQTEVDCEYLKQCCENLTEENRRLQKEVNELRALKMSPQFYMNMNPPTTLTMCPQCERVGVSSAASSPSAAAASSSTAPTSKAIARNPYPMPAPNQLPMLLNPWAAIFPNPSLDIRQPGS